MKVELLIPRTGPAGAENIGDLIDVPDDEGTRMIEAGQAIAVRSVAKPETAVPKRRAEKARK